MALAHPLAKVFFYPSLKNARFLPPKPANLHMSRSSANLAAAPLLVPTIERSDGPSITVMVESLAPARGYAMEVAPSLTVAALKERYLALTRRELEQREDGAAARGRMLSALEDGCACPFQTVLRLILDGVELEDGATLERSGVEHSSRLCVVSLRSRVGCWRLVACASHWWPLGLAVLLWSALYAAALLAPAASGADTDAARCTLWLRVLLLTGAPLLLAFGLVVAGRFQESRGRRLLWFLRHSCCVSRLVLVVGVLSCAWLALGGAWLFGGTCHHIRLQPPLHTVTFPRHTVAGSWLFGNTCEAVARDAWRGAAPGPAANATATPGPVANATNATDATNATNATNATATALLYDSALGAWALLLLLNTPWLLLPVAALLLLCRCPLAFSLIACLSGAQGGTMQQ